MVSIRHTWRPGLDLQKHLVTKGNVLPFDICKNLIYKQRCGNAIK